MFSTTKLHQIGLRTSSVSPAFRMKTSVLALSVMLAAVGLSGCSGSSNNLTEPTDGEVDNTIVGSDGQSACVSTSVDNCVRVEFLDDPVVGLNYQCGEVVDKTTNTGIARCPNNSIAQFYIESQSGERRINFGKVKIEGLQANSSNEDNFILRLTPLDFFNIEEDEITSLDDRAAQPALNVTRLLHALRDTPYIPQAPVNIIRITDEVRELMDSTISEDIESQDFGSDNFVTKTEDLRRAYKGRSMISKTEAKARLNKSLQAITASMYYQIPGLDFTSGLNQFNPTDLLFGIRGQAINNENQKVAMSVFSLTLRDGATIGQGLYWADNVGGVDAERNAYTLYLNPNFDKMRITEPSLAGVNPVTHRLNQYKWQVFKQDDQTTGRSIDFNQGKLTRQLAVIGSADLYRYYTGSELTDQSKLGRWVESENNGLTLADGRATLFRAPSTSVNTFLDPAVWLSEHVVDYGEKYVFPLHATLTFSYPNFSSQAPISMGVTFLENGDIITDSSLTDNTNYDTATKAVKSLIDNPADCAPVSQSNAGEYYQTTADGESLREMPIGTVRAAIQPANNPNGRFINPTILLSGSQFGILDGTQIGTQVLAPRVKINVSGVVEAALQNNTLTQGSINITDATGDNLQQGSTPAQWVNVYNNFISLSESNEAVNLSSEEQDKVDMTEGTVSIRLSECYELKTR